MKFRRTENVQYKTAVAEYLKLGRELENTTRYKLAEKFNVSICGMALLRQLTIDDFILLKEVLDDRAKTVERRKFLRRMIAP